MAVRGVPQARAIRRRPGSGYPARALDRLRARVSEAPPEIQVRPLLELRLVPVAAAAWFAAAIAVRSNGGAATTAGIALALAAAVLLAVALLGSNGKSLTATGTAKGIPAPAALAVVKTAARAAAVPMAAAAVVIVCAGTHLSERMAGPIGPAVAEGATIAGSFRALTDARAAAADGFSGKPRYLVEAVLEEATSGGQRFGSAATVLVIGGDGFESVHLGDSFTSSGPLQGTDPGERSVAVLYANGAPHVVPAGGWYAVTARIRAAFAAAAARYSGVYGIDAAGLLPGMALGDRSTLDPTLESAMKNTGLTHIVAVSGANCGFLLAFVFLLARTLRLPRGAAAAAGILALLGFMLLVRPDASVLRAAVMGSLGALAVLSGRGKLPASLLCLSITVLLAVDPWLSGSYAFILSVLATAGLILLGPRLTKLLSSHLPWPLAAALAVPLAAQFFCTPVLVLLQPQVPLFSLPANVAVAPVIPLVTIAGMGAAVLASTVPVLAGPLLVAAGAGAAWTAFVARSFDALPGSLLPWPAGASGAVLMAAVTGAGVVALWLVGRRDSVVRPPQRAAAPEGSRRSAGLPWAAPAWRKTAAAATVLLLLPSGALFGWDRLRPAPAPDGWMAAACDVGQGDGLVVSTGPHSAIVIDAGPDPESIDRCLKQLRVETVDLFILSHIHLDHYGGAAGVLRGREVRSIAYSTAEQQLSGPLLQALDESGAGTVRLSAGMGSRIGAVRWEVLWPPANGAPGAAENDASAVVLITVPGDQERRGTELRLLLTGDIEEEAGARLLAANAQLANDGVDILKVPHHGARNGGTQLIEELQPDIALISVGADNDYGHPAPSILRSLQETGTIIARTDLLGSVILDTDGTALRVNRLEGR
ncbi:ComEC/Rec2 family competence protein [Arthrobacter sp. ATA002]|uniref:ComEC/Rec2 family competence protein n=1 Tax=Arthrobacter sp. ATA002 TaxID=2991715 RepID=UPI0022A6F903|nr:ComEC/Rec2 family competence protein [Arthrobacter sp. ATA002]WAP53138.1 ComEC/Rec2 family competence protein [Arthrobacter sp. ATA002]